MIQIGDKVKFLNENLSGTISRIIDHKTVNVMTEDGFEIPVLLSELVLPAAVDGPAVTRITPAAEAEPVEQEGVFIAFEPGGTQNLQAVLINNSRDIVLFSLSFLQNEQYTGIASGKLDPLASQKLHTCSLTDFEQWPEYFFRLIIHNSRAAELPPPQLIKMRFRSKDFLEKLRNAPLTQRSSYLFKLDREPQADLSRLKGFKFDSPASPIASGGEKSVIGKPPATVIDLHIEQLTQDHASLTPTQKMDIQLLHFRKNLEQAYVHRFEKITFIHGLGNGVLKDAIRKVLQSERNVRTWQDAGKDKFGYGATEVFFK